MLNDLGISLDVGFAYGGIQTLFASFQKLFTTFLKKFHSVVPIYFSVRIVYSIGHIGSCGEVQLSVMHYKYSF